jgi:hypothetical protein
MVKVKNSKGGESRILPSFVEQQYFNTNTLS